MNVKSFKLCVIIILYLDIYLFKPNMDKKLNMTVYLLFSGWLNVLSLIPPLSLFLYILTEANLSFYLKNSDLNYFLYSIETIYQFFSTDLQVARRLNNKKIHCYYHDLCPNY